MTYLNLIRKYLIKPKIKYNLSNENKEESDDQDQDKD